MAELTDELPRLLPRAIAWVQTHANLIEVHGQPLTGMGLRLASSVGVRHPERIRVQMVPRLPAPEDPELQALALQQGLLDENSVGITFGYGIYMVQGYRTNRLLTHECRHVQQYEAAGSIDAFLARYLQEIAMYGYDEAPLELDAQRHERDLP